MNTYFRSHHIQEISYFKTHYIKTHMRSSAYFVGIITGAILHDHKQIKWQVPKVCNAYFFILFRICNIFYSCGYFTVLVACVSFPITYDSVHRIPNLVIQILYSIRRHINFGRHNLCLSL